MLYTFANTVDPDETGPVAQVLFRLLREYRLYDCLL